MQTTADVVIVGSGIGGSTLATLLARGGLEVLVLEREVVFRDRVRGEAIAPWGVLEVRNLGLEEPLTAAGGGYATHVVPYEESLSFEESRAATIPAGIAFPDVPGWIDVGHPDACEALAQTALASGATIARGVRDVAVAAGSRPSVDYSIDGASRSVAARMIVGADGRSSTTRRQIGIDLEQSAVRTHGAGLLVSGIEAWPVHEWAVGTVGDVYYIAIPRPGPLLRLYLIFSAEQQGRFSGPTRTRDFLDTFHFGCLPLGDAIADGTPAGPCASSTCNDSWCTEPFVDGAVLIGDAAGWNDPIIGQGLSIAFRDARMVSEILLSNSDWSREQFAPYGAERLERMRRLRITATFSVDLRATFTSEAAKRRRVFHERSQDDPSMLLPLLPILTGPDASPPDAFDPVLIERILSSTCRST